MSGHILLVGMMGAGKTTVGELVAANLGLPYFDSDAEVVAATGKTVPEIFASEGEDAFRRAEAAALSLACASDQRAVISVAGGAVLAPTNRELLGTCGTVFWLRARPETLAARVGRGVGRPLLDEDPAGTLARLATERADIYAEVADVIIDVDELSPEDVAADVIVRAS